MAQNGVDAAVGHGKSTNLTERTVVPDHRSMTIACLQFSPQVGQVDENIKRAGAILQRDVSSGIDWILLPEMAFSGYSFADKDHIKPFLEPTARGRSTDWAKRTAARYSCTVTVGYPEVAKPVAFVSEEAASVLRDLVHAPALRPFLPKLHQMSSIALKEFVEELQVAVENRSVAEESSIVQLCRKASESEIDISPASLLQNTQSLFYNALVTVSETGEILNHYRKSFLYYTDETWAEEGPGYPPFLSDAHVRTSNGVPDCTHISDEYFDIYVDPSLQQGQASRYKPTASPFFSGFVPSIGQTTFGICMDINPYRFAAPYSACEFANASLQAGSPITAVSMAWLTLLPPESLVSRSMIPDQNTLLYWAERFEPIRQATIDKGIAGEKIVVCANRCGMEGQVGYAGSSSVFVFRDQRLFILDMLGRNQEKLLIVSLDQKPLAEITRQQPPPDPFEKDGCSTTAVNNG